MIRKFMFKNVQDPVVRTNWDTLTQQLDCKVVFPNLNSFNSGTCVSFYALQGPIVFVFIWLIGANWQAGAFVEYPIAPLQIEGIQAIPQYIGQLINYQTNLPVFNEHILVAANPSNTKQAKIILPTSGSVNEGVISGHYIRN